MFSKYETKLPEMWSVLSFFFAEIINQKAISVKNNKNESSFRECFFTTAGVKYK
jgi:hypothetical protein